MAKSVSALWGQKSVKALEDFGIRHAVVAPGSRSTPLALPLALSKVISSYPILDERSASFFALGIAKQTHRPTVLVCTSGTAAANFFPAIIEARLSGVPLIILTADRPPELRDCSSGQTIRQTNIFGEYPVWSHEVATPEESPTLLAYLRETMWQAVQRSQNPFPGPVHLNMPFRDPLVDVGIDTNEKEKIPPLNNSHDQKEVTDQAIAKKHFLNPSPELHHFIERHQDKTRVLIIAGPANPVEPEHYTTQVLNLAKALGAPILADVLSPVRHYERAENTIISAYDQILSQTSFDNNLEPHLVIQLGPLPTSKVLRAWLQQLEATLFVQGELPENTDPLHRPKMRLPFVLGELQNLHQTAFQGRSPYAEGWLNESKKMSEKWMLLDKENGPIREPQWPRILARTLSAGTVIMVASSMPVRDAEWFWPVNNKAFRVLANRGANGIDGTLSTALGIAEANKRPSVLVTGDLAFLHDSNGLLNAGKIQGSLQVIVLNNNGGGIFDYLPVSQFNPPFEEYFLTPQEVDIGKLCEAHGVQYQFLVDSSDLKRCLQNPPTQGLEVLEIKLIKEEDKKLRTAAK